MRAEVKRLEERISRLKLVVVESSDANEEALVLDKQGQFTSKISVLRQAAQRLVAEKYELQQILLSYQQCTAALRRLVALSDEDANDCRVSWEDRVNHLYKGLPHEEIFRVMHECLKTMSTFELSTDFVSSGMTLLGWRDRHRRYNDSAQVQVSFSKFFPGRSAESMMTTTWDFYKSESHMMRGVASMCSRISFRVVQTVNTDTIVVQQMAERSDCERMITVFVIFRLRVGDTVKVGVRSLPIQSVTESLGPQEKWIDMNFWYIPVQLRLCIGMSVCDF
ncbi:hypothetical protein PINS_up004026 [Pythium insidiosum]|nr:hypothetical protein PINS_up004026 [Pythium insidiosum]